MVFSHTGSNLTSHDTLTDVVVSGFTSTNLGAPSGSVEKNSRIKEIIRVIIGDIFLKVRITIKPGVQVYGVIQLKNSMYKILKDIFQLEWL